MDLWSLTDLCTPWCVRVAVSLRAAEHMAAGKSSAGDLAAACGADAGALTRLLRHLASQGIFEEHQPGCFSLNDAGRQLLNESARLGLDLDGIGGRMAYAWGTLLSAVRQGRPAYDEVFGLGFWEDLEAHPDVAASFDALMGPLGHGAPDPEVLANPADWDAIRTVVDVGGGTGAQLAAILHAHPGVRGILVDLPRTVARSGPVFAAAGVADRASTSAQSFFDPLPAGADLYILKNVLGDWPDADAARILRRCAEAARPAGRVLVYTAAPGEEVASPELLMLVLVGGRGRSFEEFRALARDASLEVRGVHRQASGRHVAECVPAPAGQ